MALNTAYIPRPDKFSPDCDVGMYFRQFELFLQLTAVPDEQRLSVLLSYLDLSVFQATVTAMDTLASTYTEVKNFLLQRYSSSDAFMDRLGFFESKFSHPAEGYAASLSSLLDKFSRTDAAALCEEILVAKFITSAHGALASELRLRRPTTLNSCVQIANSLSNSVPTSSCMMVSPKKPSKTPRRGCGKIMQLPRVKTVCFRCGEESHIASAPDCPARNSQCGNCGKIGHWKKVCKSTAAGHPKVATARAQVSSVHHTMASVSRPEISLQLAGNHVIRVIVDTGADVSFLNLKDVTACHFNTQLRPIDHGFNNFDGSPIQVRGCISGVNAHFNNKSAQCTFYVADVPRSIIGMDIISALRLNISCDRPFSTSTPADTQPVIAEIHENEKPVVSIHLKKDAPASIITPARRLPFALENPVELELRKLLAADIIEPIASSPYISPIVVVNKRDNSIRLCVDYRRINACTIIDCHPIPSVDELFSKVRDARYFSKIDLKTAYHQVTIDPDSRNLTAFSTHVGLFRYKRMPYGLANAPAAFTRILQQALQSCSNLISYFDDILVFAPTKQEHDKHLQNLRSTLKAHNFEINEDKSQYGVQTIEFLGRQLSAEGIKPPPAATRAIQNCPCPTTKAELRSFLGMAGYFRCFIQHFATLATPLTRLLQEGIPFQFAANEQRAFQQLKEGLLQSPFLAFFNTDASVHTVLTTDASGTGVGAMLSQVQDGIEKPVYFVSRKLHPNETKFSSSELETLAVVWAVERLHQYVYGRTIEIRTDHSALREVLVGKRNNTTAPARITRWATRLLPYSFTVTYIKGCTNVVSDCLSRLPDETSDDSTDFNVNIAAIQGAEPPCLTMAELANAVANDTTLQKVITCISTTWAKEISEDCQPYFRFRDELCVNNGLLLRGDKIVVPSCLQQRLLCLAHENHFGISKSKSRLRRSYWWPGMDKDVERAVRNCFCCQQTPRESPVQITEWTTTPWYNLSMDIAGPKYDYKGHTFYLVSVIDDHSRYVITQVLRSIRTADMIQFLRNNFVYFGFCGKLTTDNGVQFTSSEFTEFLSHHGIVHIRSAVYNPQANGSIERVNRNFKKLLSSLKTEGKALPELQENINNYLLNYNNTVHDTTGVPPSELLFRYKQRTRLDIATPDNSPTPQMQQLKTAVQLKKKQRAEYANQRRRPLDTAPFQVGDWVQKPPGPIRYIVSKCGPFTFVLNDGYKVNTRRLKLIKRPQPDQEYIPISSTPPRRYPIRNRRAVQRYGVFS